MPGFAGFIDERRLRCPRCGKRTPVHAMASAETCVLCDESIQLPDYGNCVGRFGVDRIPVGGHGGGRDGRA